MTPKDYVQSRLEKYREEFSQIPAQFDESQIDCEELMVPVRDGAKMKTHIYKPHGIKILPVLFQRSCYPNDQVFYDTYGKEFARRGYGYVVQYSRGTGGSEGVWEPNVNERDDGIDAINWLNDQPWVESIGFFGASYLALTGWAIIDQLPPKVKGMYLSVYGTNRFASAYNDGLFRQDILTAWSMGNTGKELHADLIESCKYRPQIHVDEDLWGVSLPWYRDMISHTDFTDDYWQKGFWSILRTNPTKVKVPVVIEEGWYDHHLGSALSGYNDMPEDVKNNTLVRIGAWNHGMFCALEGHTCHHLENETIRPIYDWAQTLLKEKKHPKSGVSLYIVGRDQWLNADQWPQADRCEKFYLDTAFNALSKNAPKAHTSSFVYDPENPVPSHGAESCFASHDAVGSLKQPKPSYREDVLSFISEPFEENTLILGKISADLYVSSDAQDTAFSMKVMEVFDNGDAYNIRSGITTLAYRGHSDHRQTYTPDEIVKVNIETWDIAWEVKKGSRLRLDISSSDFPQYCAHSNYPGVWALQDRTKKAVQTIYSGKDMPSVLNIPVCNQ